MTEQVPMFSDLPETDAPKAKPRINCLQDILLELMDERKVNPAQIQKTTGIPWSTLQGWITGSVSAQLADKNVLSLARYFSVSLEYLLFGIGDDSAPYGDFT